MQEHDHAHRGTHKHQVCTNRITHTHTQKHTQEHTHTQTHTQAHTHTDSGTHTHKRHPIPDRRLPKPLHHAVSFQTHCTYKYLLLVCDGGCGFLAALHSWEGWPIDVLYLYFLSVVVHRCRALPVGDSHAHFFLHMAVGSLDSDVWYIFQSRGGSNRLILGAECEAP